MKRESENKEALMAMGAGNLMEEQVRGIVDAIMEDYKKGRDIDKMNVFDQPEQAVVTEIVQKLLNILFPGYYRDRAYRFYNLGNKLSVLIEDVIYHLSGQIAIALEYEDELMADQDMTRRGSSSSEAIGSQGGGGCISVRSQMITMEFFKTIPKIRQLVDTDLSATFDGDPAADTAEEIILCYPGLLASTVYRIAHELYLLNVPMIPRMMTEYAHSITGIDIHPGAEIGPYFFMDHGTGIVIGATSTIGEHVKLYQGVTIGALSTSEGHALHGTKRHPTIEDNVTIYSGASVLGGKTVIGKGAVIGGNAFLTSSVEPGTRVSVQNQELNFE